MSRKWLSSMAGSMGLQASLVGAVFFVMILLSSLDQVSCRTCLQRRTMTARNTSIIYAPCIQSYEEQCTIFNPFKMCTFYRQIFCKRALNFTYTKYYAIHVCCAGFVKNAEGQCVADLRARFARVGIDQTELPESQFPENYTESAVRQSQAKDLSAGAYAGIAAACLFIICVIALIVVVATRRYMKKRLVKQQSPVHIHIPYDGHEQEVHIPLQQSAENSQRT